MSANTGYRKISCYTEYKVLFIARLHILLIGDREAAVDVKFCS